MSQKIVSLTALETAQSKRTPKERHFIGIDGEAIKGTFCMLGSSEGKSIFNKNGLHYREVLDFLFELDSLPHLQKRERVFFFFAGHYDVNMIFRHLPERAKDKIFGDDIEDSKKWVRLKGGIKIHYRPKKRLSVSRPHPTKRGQRQVVVVWESFSFFNSSFIAATKKFYGNVPDIIQWGKKQRVSFRASDIKNMDRYNNEECVILVDMMEKVAGWLDELGIYTQSWHGPSALANNALKLMRITEDQMHYSEYGSPELLWSAITHSFFGGRIEALNLGSIKDCHNYDINSAYPSAMLNLPAITDLDQWVYTKKFHKKKKFGIYHVRWDVPDDVRICPFPWRSKSGLIMFPPKGEGWYHYPEVEAALEIYGPRCIEILEGYYVDAPQSRLGNAVKYLYNARQTLKSQGNPAEYVLKILLNSLYGKFAQSIGRPQFQCLPWAGYITSYTRAALLRAVRGHEANIIAFATDGIFSRTELPHLPISKELGDWDYTFFDKITVLMSGVYRKYKGDEAQCICEDEDLALKGFKCPIHSDATRGFRTDGGLWNTILDQLNNYARHNYRAGLRIPGHEHDFIPSVTTRQFITYKMGRNRVDPKKRAEMYTFVDYPKMVDPKQNDKRKYFLKEIKDWREDCCDSEPEFIPAREGMMSKPYKLKTQKWHRNDEDEEEELMMSEDGELLPV